MAVRGLGPGAADAVIEIACGRALNFALTMLPKFDRVIEAAATALPTGKRFAVLDFKKPPWPQWLLQFFLLVTRPFGVTLDLRKRKTFIPHRMPHGLLLGPEREDSLQIRVGKGVKAETICTLPRHSSED